MRYPRLCPAWENQVGAGEADRKVWRAFFLGKLAIFWLPEPRLCSPWCVCVVPVERGAQRLFYLCSTHPPNTKIISVFPVPTTSDLLVSFGAANGRLRAAAGPVWSGHTDICASPRPLCPRWEFGTVAARGEREGEIWASVIERVMVGWKMT